MREEDVPTVLDGEAVHTLRLRVTLQVKKSFVGVPEKVVTIISGGDLCGFPFTKGDKYLIHGRQPPNGEVYVSILSSTKMARDAVSDLKYLRDLPTAPYGATVHGQVHSNCLCALANLIQKHLYLGASTREFSGRRINHLHSVVGAGFWATPDKRDA